MITNDAVNEHVQPIIDSCIELINRENDAEITGTIVKLQPAVENGDVSSILNLSLIMVCMQLKAKEKLDESR